MAASDAQELDVRQWSDKWADFLTQGALGEWTQDGCSTSKAGQDLSQAVPLEFGLTKDSLSSLLPKSWLDPEALTLEAHDTTVPHQQQAISSLPAASFVPISPFDHHQAASLTAQEQEEMKSKLPSLGLTLSSGDMASCVHNSMQHMMPMPPIMRYRSPAVTDNEGAEQEDDERTARQRNADRMQFTKSERSDTSGMSDSQEMQAYNCRRARRRQSNRDSARRTRQRRLDEMKDLQDKVNALSHDRAAAMMQNRELRANYQQLAASHAQNNHDYEKLMLENLKLLHELHTLRQAISQEQALSFAPIKQPAMPVLPGAGMPGMHDPLAGHLGHMGHMGQSLAGHLPPAALSQLRSQGSIAPSRTPTPPGIPPGLGNL